MSNDGISALERALKGAIGDNAEIQSVTQFIDTGFPPLNKIISGRYDRGIPFGRIVEIFGPSSSGKTALATMLMVKAQQAGGVAGFMDHERSFNVDMAKSFGLNDQLPFWIYKRPKTWEESNMLMAKAAQAIRESKGIPDSAPILFVLDSIAACVPKSSIDKNFDELSMNDTTALARVTSTTLKSIVQLADRWNFTIVYLNQIRTKPNVIYGDPVTTPGGGAMEFFSSVRLALGRRVEKKDGEFLGQSIKIKAVKNKLTKPFQETEYRMLFNENGIGYFDTEVSLVEMMIEEGKIAQVGRGWYEFEGQKYQKNSLIRFVKENKLTDKLVGMLAK